jgi:hypothetical protein
MSQGKRKSTEAKSRLRGLDKDVGRDLDAAVPFVEASRVMDMVEGFHISHFSDWVKYMDR